MYLCFPLMHPDLLPEAVRAALPDSLRFLDPGVGDPRSTAHLTPDAAPFDRRTARALLADTLRYGESVANPRDLMARSLAQQAQALAGEGSGAVQREVEHSLFGAPDVTAAGMDSGEAGPAQAAQRQGQMLLLLAWSLEERMLELRDIDAGLRQSWARLNASVTQGDAEVEAGAADDADQEALALGRELSGMRPLEASRFAVPWRTLLEPFLLLAPGATLCAALPEIAATLADAGVAEARADLVPGAERVFLDAAWKLLGLSHLPESRPWLSAEITLAVFPPAGMEG